MLLTPMPSGDDDFKGDGDDNTVGVDMDSEVDVESESQEPTIESTTAALPVVDISPPDDGKGMEEDVGILVSVEDVAVLPPDLIVDDLAHLTTDIVDDDLIVESEAQLTDDSGTMQSDVTVVSSEVGDEHVGEAKEEEEGEEEDLSKENNTEDNMHSQSYIITTDDQQGVDEQDQHEGEELLSVESNTGNDDESHQSDDHNGDKGDALEHATTSTITNNDDNIDTVRVIDEL